MAAKTGTGESRGLIITLVFFILASIVLGVIAYFGFAENNRFDTQRKDAEKKQIAAEKERDYYRFLARQFKEYMGELPADERADFTRERDAWVAGSLGSDMKDRAAYVGLLTKLDASRKFNQQRHAADNPYAKDVATMRDSLSTAIKDNANARDDAARATAEKNAAVQRAETQKTEFDKGLEAAGKKAATDLETFSKETLAQRKAQIDQLSKEKTDQDVEIARLNAVIKTQQGSIKQQADMQRKLVEQKIVKKDAFENERPKGEIYSIDGDGSNVMLRLSSTANLPPQQTFSVRGVSPSGEATSQIKGDVVVTNVLSDTLARARVTSVRDRASNPIIRGDKIFSIGWNPSLRQHVAIAGIIDVNGTGGDLDVALRNPAEAMRRLEEFKRGLEKQGMIIDAYLDLKTLKVVGQITLETDFLIIGQAAEFNQNFRTEKAAGNKETMAEVMAAMKDEAVAKGVTLAPLRKFLAMTGYHSLRAGAADNAGYEVHPTLPSVGSRSDKTGVTGSGK